MSDQTKLDLAAIEQAIEKKADLATLKEDTASKKALLDAKRVGAQLSQLEQNERELEITKKTSFGALSPDQIKDLQNQNDDYIKAAKNGMKFICDSFDDIVPFFRKNFILIGGRTGEGKSTTVANLVFSTIAQTNPVTGKKRRALVITNEERAEDFYNRVSALAHGWHYTNHSKFTEEQINTFRKMIPMLAKDGKLTVVDNNFNGSHGVTTTIEGIEMIFSNLIRDQEWYDVIIIDYYQNIISSKEQPHLSENEVQAKLSRMMDKFKNIYPAPIVMMAQINAPDKDNKVPFQQRIKGRKIIMDPTTFVAEMVADRKNMRTQWIIHKSRFTEAVGEDFFTGYDYGRFVPYTNEFAEKVMKRQYEKQAKQTEEAINKNNGIKEVKFEGNGEGSNV